jgi:hypothetical protein
MRGAGLSAGGDALTIAACYLSPEGVVLGADSATTYGHLHYNNSQKLFQIGHHSSLGIVTWGLGGLQVKSHRTLIALLDDALEANKPTSVKDVADRWVDLFWNAYTDANCPIAPFIRRCKDLDAKKPFNPNASPPDPNARTDNEEQEYGELKLLLVAGFCIGGYVLPDRTPIAFEIVFDPLAGKPVPAQKAFGYWFWGAPNMIQRLIFACDDETKNSVLNSGKWNGTRAELDAIIQQHVLGHPIVPIRDAIDFVHACIFSTIKAFKFSSLSQICGGPIEIAVITTDRKFRWVKHKTWNAAITEGEHDGRIIWKEPAAANA